MAEHTMEHHSSKSPTQTFACSLLITRLMTQRRTWVFLCILIYTILLSSSWNILRSILSWYESTGPSSPASGSGWWPPALYAAVVVGAVLGLLSMAAAVTVAAPAIVVTWITATVLLTFCGKPRRAVEVEGRKLTAEISGFVGKILIKEGNVVAVICAVVGFFALVRRSRGEAGDSYYYLRSIIFDLFGKRVFKK